MSAIEEYKTQRNMDKYGVAWFKFDEPSGNVTDSKGTAVGTVNGATRVEGWNGEGKALSFDGVNDYVLFNNNIVNSGKKTIKFKLKMNSDKTGYILSVGRAGASNNGIALFYSPNELRLFIYRNSNSASNVYDIPYAEPNKWNDVMITVDDYKNLCVYVNGKKEFESIVNEPSSYSNTGLALGILRVTGYEGFLSGQIDNLEIYNEALTPEDFIINKTLIKTDTEYVYLGQSGNWETLPNEPTGQDYLDFGMDDLSFIPESKWQELSDKIQIKYFTDDESKEESLLTVETEPYSVYDYISETPEVLVYTETTDDIVVETTTEPFDIYDEFGDSVDVLYYTDDTAVTEADLILEANWSPLDELDGDFEVVTWTDESADTAQRVLEMTAIPQPQFIKLVNPKRLYGFLEDIIVNDISMSYRDEARYFFADTDTTKWYIYDTKTKSFVQVDTSTNDLIQQNGMTFDEINALEYNDWKNWDKEYINIGVFLKDNPRDTIVSIVDNITYKDFLPRHSTELSKTSLYILNTTAKIDLELIGNQLTGELSDDDLTRVQYRVFLNGENYYPADGSFTKLESPPQNINITISSEDIKIDDVNIVKVEFQDFFGTTDYWQAHFIGTYSGLMFKDVYGDYYTNEVGKVLQYLDFGIIIAGQTTVEHEIILKNQYGYDIENVRLDVNKANFPQGMTAELSTSLAPFTPKEYLELGSMANGDEKSFFIRLKTTLGATPNADGEFDIIVRADKVNS